MMHSPFAAQDTDGFEFLKATRLTEAKTQSLVGSHVLQNVRRRLNRVIAIHACRVLAIFARHRSAACNVSSRGIHTLKLRFIYEQ